MVTYIARVAGVEQIAVCTPPGQDACINPNLLYALDCAGATEIYKVGGAQAIAAMGCGTDSIKPVDKIFGPGNSFLLASVALESPTLAQNTLLPTMSTLTQVDPENLRLIPEFLKRPSDTLVNDLSSCSLTSVESTTL